MPARTQAGNKDLDNIKISKRIKIYDNVIAKTGFGSADNVPSRAIILYFDFGNPPGFEIKL